MDRAVLDRRPATQIELKADRRLIAASPTTTTTATTTILAGLGFVNRQRAALVVGLVQGADRGLPFLVIRHLNETKSFATTGIAVGNDLGAFNGTEFSKQLFQI